VRRGEVPLIVYRAYEGTPHVTLVRRTGASAEAWARLRQSAEAGLSAAIESDDRVEYKGQTPVVFAFEAMRVQLDAKDLDKGIINPKFARAAGIEIALAMAEDAQPSRLAIAPFQIVAALQPAVRQPSRSGQRDDPPPRAAPRDTVPPRKVGAPDPIAVLPAPRVIGAEERARLAAIARSSPSVDLHIPFEHDAATIPPAAVPLLAILGRALSEPEFADTKFLVGGHTDARGSEAHNLQLSERRAAAVSDFLQAEFGIAADRLVAVGFGKSRLKLPRDPYAEANRRVQIVAIR
jgi:outer membrane protein OmpA-like peptidoglycan-associated protein